MNITITQDNSRVEVLGSNGANIIKKLYELAIDPNNTLTLEGNISSTSAYGYLVDYLNTNYGPDFIVSTTNKWIYFEDPNVESYLASMNIGTDGKVSEALAAAVTVIANASNSTITKFNELRYFTNITESRGGWNAASEGYAKFAEWTALEEVDISNYTSLGHNNAYAWGDTFRGCTSLKKVTASNKLKKLGHSSFCYCSNLEEITGLSGTIELYGNVFLDCNKLKQSSILDCTFTYTYDLNGNFSNLFRECHALTSISLDPSITKIPYCTFYRCLNLTNVSGLQNITNYDAECFRECSNFEGPIDLTNVTNVKNEAFRMCNKLVCTGNTSNIIEFGNYCFADCDLSGATVTISVNPNPNIFANATLPSTVTIGSNVTDISNAFLNAKGEFSLTGGSSITSLTSLKDSEVVSVAFPNVISLAHECFRHCRKLANASNVAFWSSLQTIGRYCFNNCPLAGSISLPNLQSVCPGAFCNCTGLTSITFGGNTLTLPDNSSSQLFGGCTNLQYIDISGLTLIGSQCFGECLSINTLIAPDVVSVEQEAFRSATVNGYVYLPSCTTVNSRAFGSGTVPKIILPGVENIALYAFDTRDNSIIDLGDLALSIPTRPHSDNEAKTYIIRNSSVVPMDGTFNNSTWLNSTIYVPGNLISSYKSASGWSSILGRDGREVFYALENSAYASSTWYQNV